MKTEYGPGPFCTVRGTVMSGFEVYGPFDTVEEAADWADGKTPFMGPVSVMPIQSPESFGINKVESQ